MRNRLRHVVAQVIDRLGMAVARSAAQQATSPAGMARAAAEKVDRRIIYAAISELDRRHNYRSQSLTAAELQVFSQNGEDGVLAEIFSRISDGDRFFVEFGGEDGRESNTRFLREVRGWSGVYFETDAESYRKLSRRVGADTRVNAVRAAVSANNVEDLFERAGVPVGFDLLSIDIDGQDYHVWQAINQYRPRVVVIEYNSGLAAGSRLVEPPNRGVWDDTDFFGASIEALKALATSKGYRLVHAELAGVNAFFVADEWAEVFADIVPILRVPNYWLQGAGHPPDPLGRPYEQV